MSFSGRAFVATLAVLAAIRLASAAEPRAGTLELDPTRTVIEFRLPGRLHMTHGTFKLGSGRITADPRTGVAGGTIEVDAASGDSGFGARDRRMTEDVLEAQEFQKIVFAPRHLDGHIDPNGNFRVALRGEMTIHGSRHDMVIDAQGRLVGDDVAATCHFSIPYVEWGMKDPSLLFLEVEKHVDIDVATAGHVFWNGEIRRNAATLNGVAEPRHVP